MREAVVAALVFLCGGSGVAGAVALVAQGAAGAPALIDFCLRRRFRSHVISRARAAARWRRVRGAR